MARTSWAMEGRPGFSTLSQRLTEPVVVAPDANVDARAWTETERRPEDDVRLGQVVKQEQGRVAVVGQARLHERVLEPMRSVGRRRLKEGDDPWPHPRRSRRATRVQSLPDGIPECW